MFVESDTIQFRCIFYVLSPTVGFIFLLFCEQMSQKKNSSSLVAWPWDELFNNVRCAYVERDRSKYKKKKSLETQHDQRGFASPKYSFSWSWIERVKTDLATTSVLCKDQSPLRGSLVRHRIHSRVEPLFCYIVTPDVEPWSVICTLYKVCGHRLSSPPLDRETAQK